MRVNNLDRNTLAKKLNIDYDILHHWVFWNCTPDTLNKCRIAEILGVPVSYLSYGKYDYEINLAEQDTKQAA